MPINHVPGLREFKNVLDPRYERFTKEYYKTRGKTNLLTDTTIEQLNSSLPDGTILYTGKQSRTPFLNDGTTMENYNVPLTTLPIENRLKNEPRKETTTMDLLKIEEQRRLENNLPTRSQLRFITEEENLDNEVTNEIIKRQQAQQEFNNQKNKKAIQNEKLIELSQNERLNLRLQPLIEREKRIANLSSFSPDVIGVRKEEATGLRGRPSRAIISYEDPYGKRTEVSIKQPTYAQVTRKRK